MIPVRDTVASASPTVGWSLPTTNPVTFTEEEGVSTKFRVVVSSTTRVTGRVRLSKPNLLAVTL